MSSSSSKAKLKREDTSSLIWTLLSRKSDTPSDEEVAYFREHPDQIDEVSSPVNLHRLFLSLGLLLGTILVGVSKFFEHTTVLAGLHEGLQAFIVDIVFEIGVALIGASIVTFMLSLVLNDQLVRVKKWKEALRKRIEETEH